MNYDGEQREFVIQCLSWGGYLWQVVTVLVELLGIVWCGDGLSVVLDSDGGIGGCLHSAPQLSLLVIWEAIPKHFNKHCSFMRWSSTTPTTSRYSYTLPTYTKIDLVWWSSWFWGSESRFLMKQAYSPVSFIVEFRKSSAKRFVPSMKTSLLSSSQLPRSDRKRS